MMPLNSEAPSHSNPDRPIIPKHSHPVETGRYLLATNEIDRLYQKVSQCITNRSPGAIIYGRPRLGKTRALNYLLLILPESFEKIPIYFITSRRYKNPNENIFFEDLLKDIGHGIPYAGKANVKRERLLKYLVEKTNTTGLNRLIFLIDDAQHLHGIHYEWLMDLDNELDRHGISLTVFLFGQKELEDQRSVFLATGKQQIIGRFMVQQFQFSGIKTLEDLKECLISYDEHSEHPAGTDVSFTHYYFPHVFMQGFRLADYAETLFHLFENIRKEAGLRGKMEIPMQYLTLSVEYVLKNFGYDNECLSSITVNQWAEAIESSGYIDAEIIQNITRK